MTERHSVEPRPAAPAVETASFAARPMLGLGRVWHRRLQPAEHEFSHASYFLLLPMRSLRAAPHAPLHRNRFAALSFHDRDHGDGEGDALAWFEALLAREGVRDADGEVWLQTYPRVLGHVFKPVSFWYATRRDGTLAAVLAEVNNTFGQRHAYLLHGPTLRWGGVHEAAKAFHVSPFFAVDGHYRFRFLLDRDAQERPRHVVAGVDLHDEAGTARLRTRQSGTLQPLTPSSRWRAFYGVPLMTFGVVARIHWHALRLALKRIPFHRCPPAPEHFVTR